MKDIYFYPKLKTKEVFFDIMFQTILTISVGITVFRSCSNVKEYKSLKRIFLKIDSYLGQNKYDFKKSKMFYIELVISHLIIAFLFVYDAFVTWRIIGLEVYWFYIVREIDEYCIFITVLLIYNYVLSIKLRLQRINSCLFETVKDYMILSKKNLAVVFIKKNPKLFIKAKMTLRIRHLRRFYYRICKLVDILNELFGWSVLFLCIFIVVELLMVVNVAILVFTKQHDEILLNTMSDFYIISFSVFWCVELLVSKSRFICVTNTN